MRANNSNVSDALLALAEKCQGLVDFSFGCVEDGSFLAEFAERSPKLRSVKLWGIDDTSKGVVGLLRRCRALERLEIDSCDFDDAESVAESTGLLDEWKSGVKTLVIFLAWGADDSFIAALVRHCPHLELFWFNHEPGASNGYLEVSDNTLRALGESCPELNNASFDFGERMSDAGVEALARGCSQLTNVAFRKFGDSPYLTDTGVEMLAKNCTKLREIEFEDCLNLTDASAVALARYLPHLEKVLLEGEGMTDAVVGAIVTGCRKLKTVSLSCPQLTDASAMLLARQLPLIQCVILHEKSRITAAGASALGERVTGWWPDPRRRRRY